MGLKHEAEPWPCIYCLDIIIGLE
uniref:Uncharacterized protein n=1 Tax=Rhizophora mucronata TaxID=61149 RepID=A0A2P2PX73_RHIMU